MKYKENDRGYIQQQFRYPYELELDQEKEAEKPPPIEDPEIRVEKTNLVQHTLHERYMPEKL